MSVDSVLLQSDIPVDMLDMKDDPAVRSFSPSRPVGAPRGPLHGGGWRVLLFYADVPQILMVLWHFKGTRVSLSNAARARSVLHVFCRGD